MKRKKVKTKKVKSEKAISLRVKSKKKTTGPESCLAFVRSLRAIKTSKALQA